MLMVNKVETSNKIFRACCINDKGRVYQLLSLFLGVRKELQTVSALLNGCQKLTSNASCLEKHSMDFFS